MATIKKGTYRFNDTLTFPDSAIIVQIRFETHWSMKGSFQISPDSLAYEDISGTSGDMVYQGGEWMSDKYKTITIPGDNDVIEEFYDWFTSNAVAQISGKWKLGDNVVNGGENFTQEINFTSVVDYKTVNYIAIKYDVSKGNLYYLKRDGEYLYVNGVRGSMKPTEL